MSDKRDDFTSFFFSFCVSRAEAAEEETLCVETSKLSLGADDPRDDDGNLKVNASSWWWPLITFSRGCSVYEDDVCINIHCMAPYLKTDISAQQIPSDKSRKWRQR